MSLRLHICGVAELSRLSKEPVTHLISIWDAHREDDPEVKREIESLFPNAAISFHFFDDVEADYPATVPPSVEEVERILDFTADLKSDAKLLIHCHAGVSRSTASAFAIASRIHGAGRESATFSYVKNLRPVLFPNLLIVQIADDLLGRGGAMVREVLHHRSRVMQSAA